MALSVALNVTSPRLQLPAWSELPMPQLSPAAGAESEPREHANVELGPLSIAKPAPINTP
jgi:hypothetical protein